MAYNKKTHDRLKKSLKDASSKKMEEACRINLESYEDMHSIEIKVNNKFKKKPNDKD